MINGFLWGIGRALAHGALIVGFYAVLAPLAFLFLGWLTKRDRRDDGRGP